MALSNILNPPIHTEFLLRGSAAVIDEDTILGYDPPLPDLLSRTDYVILKIDATPRQTHRMQQDVPEYPIETGFNIVDDVLFFIVDWDYDAYLLHINLLITSSP